MNSMVSDKSLRDAVVKELEDEPEVAATYISVTAVDGAVTLGGHVMTHHEKHVAVRVAERVDAVRAVADGIEVRETSLHERPDDEIARQVAQLRGLSAQSPDSVAVQVREGRVILHGHVESTSQRDAIERAARQLAGVHAVSNLIEVESQADPTLPEVERRVREAVAQAGDPADSIRATMAGGTVRLHGRVASLAALQAALDAAESAPGITAVESEVVLSRQPDGELDHENGRTR